jgi:hypothetical protein
MSGEQCSRGGVVELTTIVTLNIFDGVAKLCGDKGEKIWQGVKCVRFNSQRKGPHKVGGIINNEYVVFVARPETLTTGEVCDIPPLSKGGQSEPGSIWGANTEALTHNTHMHGPNKELLYEFLSYKRDT